MVIWKVRLWMIIILIFVLIVVVIVIALAICAGKVTCWEGGSSVLKVTVLHISIRKMSF